MGKEPLMNDYLLFLQGVVWIFAAIGFYLTVRIFLDAVVKRRSGLKMRVVILSYTGDPEYAVRFAESRFVYGEYAGFFEGVTLSESLPLDKTAAARLKAEFPDFVCFSEIPEKPTEQNDERTCLLKGYVENETE